jgi:hypothetical protein
MQAAARKQTVGTSRAQQLLPAVACKPVRVHRTATVVARYAQSPERHQAGMGGCQLGLIWPEQQYGVSSAGRAGQL